MSKFVSNRRHNVMAGHLARFCRGFAGATLTSNWSHIRQVMKNDEGRGKGSEYGTAEGGGLLC